MRGGEAPVLRSATGQDGDTGSVPAAVGGLPLPPGHPSAPAAAVKDARDHLHHQEPSRTHCRPHGTPWRADPFPTPIPSELYLCTCVRYGPQGASPA